MCQLAFGTLPGFEVSDIEFRISGKSYTVHTLERLREKYLDAEFFLLMGGDMFMTFHRWYRCLLYTSTVMRSRLRENITALAKANI